MLASTADSAQFWQIGQNWPCYLAQPLHALFARISCNTFLESLKHTDQPWVGFVSGAWSFIKNCLSLLCIACTGPFSARGTLFLNYLYLLLFSGSYPHVHTFKQLRKALFYIFGINILMRVCFRKKKSFLGMISLQQSILAYEFELSQLSYRMEWFEWRFTIDIKTYIFLQKHSLQMLLKVSVP